MLAQNDFGRLAVAKTLDRAAVLKYDYVHQFCWVSSRRSRSIDVTTTEDRITRGVRISSVAGNIGAELSGVDLTRELSDDTIAEIRRALLAHKVVFFRDQDLSYESQVAFAQRFGPLTLGHPTLPSPPGQPLLEEIDSDFGPPANQWHTDVTFVEQPPAFTFL